MTTLLPKLRKGICRGREVGGERGREEGKVYMIFNKV